MTPLPRMTSYTLRGLEPTRSRVGVGGLFQCSWNKGVCHSEIEFGPFFSEFGVEAKKNSRIPLWILFHDFPGTLEHPGTGHNTTPPPPQTYPIRFPPPMRRRWCTVRGRCAFFGAGGLETSNRAMLRWPLPTRRRWRRQVGPALLGWKVDPSPPIHKLAPVILRTRCGTRQKPYFSSFWASDQSGPIRA